LIFFSFISVVGTALLSGDKLQPTNLQTLWPTKFAGWLVVGFYLQYK